MRTPPRSPRNQTHKEYTNVGEKCVVHIAEIYTLHNRISKLSEELEETKKTEAVLKAKLETLQLDFQDKYTQKNIELEQEKLIKNELLEKIKFLNEKHSYVDLISFYENKIDEYVTRHKNHIKTSFKLNMPVQSVSQGGVNIATFEVWQNLLKKYEKQIIELQQENEEMHKRDRKVSMRQKIFEKYCSLTEDKIIKFSKISKKILKQESAIKELTHKAEHEISEKNLLSQRTTLAEKELIQVKEENSKMKKFIEEVKPILKITWDDIRRGNSEWFRSLGSDGFHKPDSKSQGIMALLENIKDFIQTLQESLNNQLYDFSPIINIVDDVKSYITLILDRIQYLKNNQYDIINSCCDLNSKIMNYTKSPNSNKIDIDFLSILKDVRNTCSKLLLDLNPK